MAIIRRRSVSTNTLRDGVPSFIDSLVIERHGKAMTYKREDILEDYEIKQAMEQTVQRSEQRVQQLSLRFEPEKRRPTTVTSWTTERKADRR